MSDSLTLIDAAERLDVHYMTAYRYVRTGRLPAHKVGGQWQVLEDDLATFVEIPLGTRPRREVVPHLVEERLLAGDENGTYQLVEDAMASGANAEEVYLDLIAKAMVSIGERWHAGDVTIADEHVASSTALRVIARLGPRVASRGRTKGTILLATISDDYHYLPTAILRDLLRVRGYEVQDLGANTPAESILERAHSLPDLLAVGLSATSPGHDAIVTSTIAVLSATLTVPVVVGGSAFVDCDHIESLGDCLPSRSAHHALDLFDEIHAEARSRAR